MIILGLDPGLARTGFGLVSLTNQPTYIACGIISTPADQPLADRLSQLGRDLTKLITQHQPDRAVVEELFFGNNKKTAIAVSHARGVLIYILRQHHIPIQSLTPLQVKSQLTGYGAATKEQIQSVVTNQLSLISIPQPDDAADALACALCTVPTKLPLR